MQQDAIGVGGGPTDSTGALPTIMRKSPTLSPNPVPYVAPQPASSYWNVAKQASQGKLAPNPSPSYTYKPQAGDYYTSYRAAINNPVTSSYYQSPKYSVDSKGRPIYNGTQESRLAQAEWDRNHPTPAPMAKPTAKPAMPTMKGSQIPNWFNTFNANTPNVQPITPTMRPYGQTPALPTLQGSNIPTTNIIPQLMNGADYGKASAQAGADGTDQNELSKVWDSIKNFFTPHMVPNQTDIANTAAVLAGMNNNNKNNNKNNPFIPKMVNGTDPGNSAGLANEYGKSFGQSVDQTLGAIGKGIAAPFVGAYDLGRNLLNSGNGQTNANPPTYQNPEANAPLGNTTLGGQGTNPLGWLNQDFTGNMSGNNISSDHFNVPTGGTSALLSNNNTLAPASKSNNTTTAKNKVALNNQQVADNYLNSLSSLPGGQIATVTKQNPLKTAQTVMPQKDTKTMAQSKAQNQAKQTMANWAAAAAKPDTSPAATAGNINASQLAGGSDGGVGFGNANFLSTGGGSMAGGGIPTTGATGATGATGSGMDTSGGAPSFLQLDLSPQEQQSLMTWANSQALLQNNVQRNSLDLQANQQKDAYNAQVNQLNNQEVTAEKQLENQSFQNYLDSRQQIADRGLASSGLANDANTRLMLSRDQQLGQLQQQNSASLASALATENTNLANIGAQRSQINDQVTSNNLFNQLYQSRLQMQQQANQLAEDWAKWNTTSGNYAYRFGISAQNAQLSAATKLQVAQMSNQMKLATNDATNQTKLSIANGNLQAKMAQINSQNWNYGQQQYISMAKDLGTQAAQVLKAIPNATSPQEQQQLIQQYNDLTSSMAQNLGYAQDNSNSGFNYSTGGSGAGYTGAGLQNVSGSGSMQNNAQQLYNFLRSNGLNAAAAAGVLGNLQQESSLNPAEAGGGLAQWIGSRGQSLAAYAKSIGQSPNSLQAQAGYLMKEITSGAEGVTIQSLNAAGNPSAAAQLFSNRFERPGIPMMNNRINYANNWYNAFGGK